MGFTVLELAIDMIGVLFIFLFGLPSKQEPEGHTEFVAPISPEEQNEARKHNKPITIGAYAGLSLLLLGYLLQIIGSFYPENF